MPVDQTGKQGRAGAVIDDLRAAGCRLDRTHLEDPTPVIDENLGTRPNRLAIEDRVGTEDPHPPMVIPPDRHMPARFGTRPRDLLAAPSLSGSRGV